MVRLHEGVEGSPGLAVFDSSTGPRFLFHTVKALPNQGPEQGPRTHLHPPESVPILTGLASAASFRALVSCPGGQGWHPL